MREIRFRSSFKGLKISQSSQKNMHQSFFWDIMHERVKNFTKFTEKHMHRSLFNKVAGCRQLLHQAADNCFNCFNYGQVEDYVIYSCSFFLACGNFWKSFQSKEMIVIYNSRIVMYLNRPP